MTTDLVRCADGELFGVEEIGVGAGQFLHLFGGQLEGAGLLQNGQKPELLVGVHPDCPG